MASVLIDWGTKLGAKLGELALGEARYLICFKCIAEEFEKEKNKLIERKKSVEEDVVEARNRVENVRYEVHAWLKEADKYIKEEYKKKSHEKDDKMKKMTISHGWCPKCLELYYRGKELDGMKLEILELRKQNFEKVGRTAKVPGVEFYAPQNFIELKSRTSAYKQVLEALKDGNNYMVGLHGLGGTGKTTLAEKAGLELKVQKVFDEVVFTTVSKDPNITKIQEEIASPLGLPLKEETETDRPKKLWSRLTKGEKILIILDDVWDKLDFNAIGIPHSGNDHGCRVLLTSRDAGVCNSMGCEKFITLEPLSDEDAQILFESLAGISNKSSKDFKDKGREIAKECKGLPVAIATIASTLKGRPLKDWRAALTALKSVGDTDEFIEIYKRLKVSYDRLNNDEAKRLLLLCSLFPEDYEIPVEDFTNFSIGLGLFGDVHVYEATRTRVDKARTKLIDSCLLLEGEEGCVKMHDLVRDAAHWIANNERQFGILDMVPERNAIEKHNTNAIRYLYCRGIFINDHLDWTKLEILILADIDEEFVDVQEAFFEKMKNLRVLALNNGDQRTKLNLPLPRSFESLKYLRTLRLSNFKLNNFPVMENLQCLEILELRGCIIDELPIVVTKLGNLRLLSMTRCIFGENPYKVIGQLSNIQELYFKNIYNAKSGGNWDLNMEVIANLFGKDRISKTLQRYHIEIRDGSESYGWTFDHSISRAVAIQYFHPDASNAPIMDLVRRAECLDLLQIQGGYKAVIPDIIEAIGGDMNELISFTLYSCSKIEYLIDATNVRSLPMAKIVFSKLVELYLFNMDALRTLCYSSSPQELSFERLKLVCVDSCPALTSLFSLSIARSLVVLEELVIRECRELKCIITYEQSKEGEIVEEGGNQMFPKLKTLTISECDRLGFIFPTYCAGDLPLLENIEISSCGDLEYIFGQSRLHDQVLHPNRKEIILPSLEKMELHEVPKFVNIFPRCCHPNPLSSFSRRLAPRDFHAKHQSPHKQYTSFWARICCLSHAFQHKLRKSSTNTENPIVSNVRSLDSTVSLGLQTSNCVCVRPSDTAQCILGQSLILRNIKEMSLINCGEIISLFSLSIAAKMLLEQLTVDKCQGLKHIITDVGSGHDRVVFPKLKHLSVKDCSRLEYIMGQNHDESHNHNIEVDIELPALEEIHLKNLEKIINICPKSYNVTCPSLKELSVNNCLEFTITTIYGSVVGFDTRQMNCPTTKASNSKCLLPIDTTHYVLRQSAMLQIVQRMKLKNCGKIESLFTLSTASKMSLEELTIDTYDELTYLITDMGGNHDTSIFPKLKKLTVRNCSKLKYMVGRYHDEGSNRDIGIHINLHILKDLILENLPNILGICPVDCYATCPSLNSLSADNCPKFVINSISSFKDPIDPLDHTTIEELWTSNFVCVRHSDSVECLMGQSLTLHNIKKIKFTNFGEITSLFSLSMCAKMLLEELTIWNCDGLKHIIADMGDSHDHMSILPKLKKLRVRNCSQMTYIVGGHLDEGPNYKNGIHIHLPALEDLNLWNLSNMVDICPINYYATHPALKDLDIRNCSNLAIKSVSDFMMARSDAAQLDGTATVGLVGIVKHLQILETLNLQNNIEIEDIFGDEGVPIKDGEQMSFSLRAMTLINLPKLKYIWRGLDNFVTLQNLKELKIEGCEELEVIFSASMLRRIPVLKQLTIRNCQKLEKIVEEDEENVVSPLVCFPELKAIVVRECNSLKHVLSISTPNQFPKLKAIVVRECNSLKHVLSISTPNQFPKLKFVMIAEGRELEQVFRAKLQGRSECEIEEPKQVLLPKLKAMILIKLPKVTNVMELETVEYRAVLNCNSNITLTSTAADLKHVREDGLGYEDPMNLYDNDLRWDLRYQLRELIESYDKDSKNQETAVETSTAEITVVPSERSIKNLSSEMEAVEECERPSSQLISESNFKDQQQAHAETPNTIEIPQDIKSADKKDEQSQCSKSEEVVNASSTLSKPKNVQSSTLIDPMNKASLQNIEETEGHIQKKCPKSNQEIVKESLSKKADLNETSSTSLESQPSPSPQMIEKSKEQILKEWFKSKEKVDDHIATLSISSKTKSAQSSSSVTLMHKASPQEEPMDEHFGEPSLKDQQESTAKMTEQSLEESSKSKQADYTRTEKSKEDTLEECFKLEEKEGDHMVTSSAPSVSERAQSSSSITPIHKASSQDNGVAHVPMPPISIIAEEHPTVKDNLVAKVFADLEVYLKMPLKDIASSESNRIRLETSLNFLSCFFTENGALSHQVKSIIDSLQEELPEMLCSFNEASAIVKKFAELEEREKSIKEKLTKQTQAEFSFAYKISQIHKLKDEAQQRETRFKNQISNLHVEMEFETLKKDKSQMEEKKRKAQLELLKTEYEWSFLCCRFKDNQRAGKVPTSTHLRSRSSMIFLHLNEAYPKDKIEVIQSETSTIEHTEDIPINLQDLEDSHVSTLFRTVEVLEEEGNQVCMPAISPVATENSVTEDDLVSKVLSDLEVSLKMPLKDIATSEDNTVRLYTALNFLSDLEVSYELKAIINSLHQDIPNILSSFIEALVVIKEFGELEEREKSFEEELARRKESSISFDFVSLKEKFMDEVKAKEAVLKEQIIWLQVELESLKEKIKDYDASLSSFQEQKSKCAADVKRLRKEFESMKKDKEEMLEDQRKAQRKLLETNYKWRALCSRFKVNRIAPGRVF